MGLKVYFIGILLLGAGLTSSVAQAFYVTDVSECSTIDLRNEFPLAMRDQGSISWCYAHSSADYLQFYFKIPTQISAADMAIQYNLRWWPRLLQWFGRQNVAQTGFARTVMADVLESGYCPEKYFPSEKWKKKITTGSRSGETELKPIQDAVDDLMDLRHQVEMGLYLNKSELPYTYEFASLSSDQFYEILARSTSKTLLNNLRLAACEGHREPFPGKINHIGMRLRGRHTFERINAVLDTHTPLNVDFFSGVLENADRFSYSLGSLHTTLLMGRKANAVTGECQYLIKNSYGPTCEGYDSRHECEAGYVWVNESLLYRALTSYVYISDVLVDDSGEDFNLPKTEMTEPAFDDQGDQSASSDHDE